MKHHLLRVIVVLLSTGFWGSALLTAEEPDDYVPVKLAHPLETTIPNELKPLLMENPRVKFHVLVSPAGDISDYLAVDATHYGLLEKGATKLQEAKFEPARKGGEPVVGKITVIITFFDPEQRAWQLGGQTIPMGASVSDAIARKMYEANKDKFRYLESKPNELDQPLQILESKLYIIHPPEEEAPTGQVMVEYFVDYEGNVRLPNIIRSDNENLSLSVLMSLKETRFNLPKRDGQPTYVRVRQPFNFN